MSRRSRGDGSVRFRNDGRWEAAISIAGRRYWLKGQTQAEIRTNLAELKRQRHMGELVAPRRLTAAQILDQWTEAGATDWKPKTRHGYRVICEHYFGRGTKRPTSSRLHENTLPTLPCPTAPWGAAGRDRVPAARGWPAHPSHGSGSKHTRRWSRRDARAHSGDSSANSATSTRPGCSAWPTADSAPAALAPGRTAPRR